ncbi:MAG: stage II sporulation protein M [Conexivisphaerales archaeon]
MSVERTKIGFWKSFRSSVLIWQRNPSLTVPYMFTSSIAALVQSVFVIFTLPLLLRLITNGTLVSLIDSLNSGNTSDFVNLISTRSFLLTVSYYLLPALFIAIAVSTLASGVTYSSEYNSYLLALKGARITIDNITYELMTSWRKITKVNFLSYSLTFLPVLVVSLLSLLVALGKPNPVIIPVLGLLYALAISATIAMSLLLMYTQVIAVAEKGSAIQTIKKSFSFAKSNLGLSLSYALTYLLVSSLLLIAGSSSNLGLPLFEITAVLNLIFIPILHLTKTNLYFQSVLRGSEESSTTTDDQSRDSILAVLLRIFKRSLSNLLVFIKDRKNIYFHIIAILFLGLGIPLGAYLGNTAIDQALYALGYVPGKINPLATSTPASSLAVYIGFHNWQIALEVALSGIWFIFSTVTELLFNGVVIGVVSSLVPSIPMFLAAILPHGIIELPCFVIAGSAGIRLGFTFALYISNRNLNLSAVVRQTVYVIIGLLLFFFIAGIIESNITPAVMKLAGWT